MEARNKEAPYKDRKVFVRAADYLGMRRDSSCEMKALDLMCKTAWMSL